MVIPNIPRGQTQVMNLEAEKRVVAIDFPLDKCVILSNILLH